VLKVSNEKPTVNKLSDCSPDRIVHWPGSSVGYSAALPNLFQLATYKLMLYRHLLTDAFSHLLYISTTSAMTLHRIVITAQYLNAHFFFAFLFVYMRYKC